MATAVHCLLCFEALDAELNGRKPMSLSALQTSYTNYLASSDSKPRDPALRRVADASGDSSSTTSSTTASSTASPAIATPSQSTTPATSTSSLPLDHAPLFVTWNTLSSPAAATNGDDDEDDNSDDTSLRGCIGTFEAQPLSSGIPEYAIISALHDSRFPPITARELPTLQACVTLLTDFEEVDDPYDWVVGTHGVRLSFVDKGRRYGSTYLPDVASEQGWTREEALFSLVRKAGWMGPRAKYKQLELRVTRYQGKKAAVNHAQYKRWREWVAETT